MFQVIPILWVLAGIALGSISFLFLDRYWRGIGAGLDLSHATGFPCPSVLPWCRTPMLGSVLPHFWHRSGMLPMNVSAVIRGGRKSSFHGMSVILPQAEHVARRCE